MADPDPFDEWTAPLPVLTDLARRNLVNSPAYADHLLGVLQARAALEAADETRRLVRATWALAIFTLAVALGTIALVVFGE